ncbi:MAG: hypothetical protein ACE366_14220 [Bradymonadia bacterium]
MKRFNALVPALLALSLAACGDDDATESGDTALVKEGIQVTMRNTLQDPGQPELTYAELFGESVEAFDEVSTVSYSASEFATALEQSGVSFMGNMVDVSGLYDIDIDGNSISFTLLPSEDDPFWKNVFELHPEGKFDRYYLTFAEPHGISGFSSDEEAVNLRIDSDTVVVVEIGAGYNMAPGAAFNIDLK